MGFDFSDPDEIAIFAEEHAAGYDQQMEEAKTLISRSKAWAVVALVADDKGAEELHSVIAKTPGVSTKEFGVQAIQALVSTVGAALQKEVELGYGEETTE